MELIPSDFTSVPRRHRRSFLRLDQMSKRFAETSKWRDLWWRRLSGPAKLVWYWAWENCDAAGVIGIDISMATFEIGMKISDSHVVELVQELIPVGCEKFWIKSYVSFQNGKLSEACPAHKPVIAAVLSHSSFLVYSSGLVSLLDSLSDRVSNTQQERERERVQGRVQENSEGDARGGLRPLTPEEEKEKGTLSRDNSEEAEAIYEAYPRKEARPNAIRAIKKALVKMPFEELLRVVKAFAAIPGREMKFIPMPATWFNAERYLDHPSMWCLAENRNKPGGLFGSTGEDRNRQAGGERVHAKIV